MAFRSMTDSRRRRPDEQRCTVALDILLLPTASYYPLTDRPTDRLTDYWFKTH